MAATVPSRNLPSELLALLRATRWQSPYHRPGPPYLLSRLLPKPSNTTTQRNFSAAASTHHQPDADSAPSSSVSPDEVNHFSKLAASWWDPHGSSRLLHLMNPLRHDFIQSCLQQTNNTTTQPPPTNPNQHRHQQQQTYLDIGCGGGIFAVSAARLPHTSTVLAIDPTPSVIAVARKKQRTDPSLSEPKLRFLQSSIEDLPADQSPVSIVTIFEVLEHVSHPSTFLTSCLRHVKPGGWLIGSTIARSALSYLTTKVIAEAPVVGVVPAGTHDWAKYVNPEELREWCETQSGLELGPLVTQGVVYLPGFGWRVVERSEGLGNYFFGVQRLR